MNKVLFTLLSAAIVTAAPSARSQGNVVALHSGNNNPTDEGFQFSVAYGAPQTGPITNDLGMDAWSTRVNNSSAVYSSALPDLTGLDWRLSVTVRIVEDSVSRQVFGAGLGSSQYLYGLFFGSDTNGDPVVAATALNARPVIVLTGAGSTYHNYQLVYNAASASASLWVDGVERFSGLKEAAGNTPLLSFGVGYQAPVDLQANWNLVSLEIIPEPGSFALVALGAAFLVVRLLAKRCRVP